MLSRWNEGSQLTSQSTYTSGENPSQIPEGITAIETESAGSSRGVKVNLLPTEREELDDLYLNLLVVKADSETQGSAMSEKEDDTPILK